MNTDRFKFRVWDKENERYLPTCDIAIDGDLKVYLWDREHDEWLWYSGDPLIEQCTGLKDKNGRLIYEGDVVKIAVPGIANHIVGWDSLRTRFVLHKFKQKPEDVSAIFGCSLRAVEQYEIVGNIHESKWGIEK